MNNFIVIVFFDFGFSVDAVGLTHQEADDLCDELIKKDIYKKVLIGNTKDYFGYPPPLF